MATHHNNRTNTLNLKKGMVVCLFFIVFSGCNPLVYNNSINKHLDTASSKGEVVVSAGGQTSNRNIGIGASASVAPTRRLTSIVSYDVGTSHSSISLAPGIYFSKMVSGEDGSVDGSYFDIFFMYSHLQTQARNTNAFDFEYDLRMNDWGLLLGYHVRQKYVGFDMGLKPHVIDPYKLKLYNKEVDLEFLKYTNSTHTIVDLMSKLRFGTRKLNISAGGSIVLNGHNNTRKFYDTYSLSIGITSDLSSL